MEKKKTYPRVIFSADIIKEAYQKWLQLLIDEKIIPTTYLQIISGSEEWEYDNDEEFYADYRKKFSLAFFSKQQITKDRVFCKFDIIAVYRDKYTDVSVALKTRAEIESVFEIFEKHAPDSMLPEKPAKKPEPPVIFIGHGRNEQWRDLKDHLHEQHGYEVEAYEIGARAGHATRDILEEMMKRSSFAILVMTGEDEGTEEGKLRARQNVVHEIGLFQGKHGFNKAIILLEEGTEEFSNIESIYQIRFSKGNIKETFGDVLATLRREFGSTIQRHTEVDNLETEQDRYLYHIGKILPT